jgi:hypothetical protein
LGGAWSHFPNNSGSSRWFNTILGVGTFAALSGASLKYAQTKEITRHAK